MKIYVATSWRNDRQPGVVTALREEGHVVYDFRNPKPGDTGFHWSWIDPDWETWDAAHYVEALEHHLAVSGYQNDFAAMEWADAFVLVLPCGRSAHLEFGWACGQGKQAIILLADGEPELMNKMATSICCSLQEVIRVLDGLEPAPKALAGVLEGIEQARNREFADPAPDLEADGRMILANEERDRFLSLLENPPEPAGALVRAARWHREQVISAEDKADLELMRERMDEPSKPWEEVRKELGLWPWWRRLWAGLKSCVTRRDI